MQVESLEKERDFYFGKLRDVEILLQAYTGPDRATVDALFKSEWAGVSGMRASPLAGSWGPPAVIPLPPLLYPAVLYATDDDFVAEGDDGGR